MTTALTIGTFDGVHRGHQRLVQRARSIVGTGGRVVAVAFAAHPMMCLRPERVPLRLDTVEQRVAWLRESGADEVELLHPTPELLGQEPAAFIGALVERHRPVAIVAGDDFHFGRQRRGTVATLTTLGTTSGDALNFRTDVVAPVEVALCDQSIVTVRSTLVRWLLSNGRVADAARCLGRHFEIVARIVPGDRRGRTIGYPTANLDLTDRGHGPRLLPASGIYAGTAVIEGTPAVVEGGAAGRGVIRAAAISIGTKPTFGESLTTCEAHLLDHDAPDEDYGWTIRLRFHEWLRDQLRYPSLEPLLEQIARDVAATRSIVAGSATLASA